MPLLSDISFKTTYRSNGNSLVTDFYLPCYERSILYRRAVGYFTSSGMAVVAKGIAKFISTGGMMRLIASPRLEKRDIDAIDQGYKSREQVVDSVINRELDEIEDALIKDRISALAWMVEVGILDIKLALPVDNQGKIKSGLYHEKVGIFSDKAENFVAFTGSPNETQGGLLDNYESIEVFWSWDDQQNRGQEKVLYFDSLWDDNSSGLAVYPFSKVCKDKLLEYKKTTPPIFDLKDFIYQVSLDYTGPDLWEHQDKAIQAWIGSNRKGILCMATGSGKTITSIKAATKCEDLKLLVVGVPRLALVDQWEMELKQNTSCSKIIRVCESSETWQESLYSRLLTLHQEAKPLIVVGTLSSLSGDKFLGVINDTVLPEKSLIIVDEVHNAGSTKNKRSLSEKFNWRLGLSATPARHYDEEGTNFINEYFGGIKFNYGLKQALLDGFLCPYKYYP